MAPLTPSETEVAVVVATRNRHRRLAALLEALGRQSLDPARFEVIVCDDGSGDGSAEMLSTAAERSPFALRVIFGAEPVGPATARNRGWRLSTAPLIAFTDDDCEPATGWLEALLTAGAAGRVVVQGRTEPIPREIDRIGPFSRTLQVTGLGPWYEACNIAYPRATLEELSGFDQSYPLPGGEDTDLALRAIENNIEVVFAPDALVHHAVEEMGPLGILRVARRWTSSIGVYRRHPALRRQLWLGVFWKPSHGKLLLALAGVAVARRLPLALLLALPYYRELYGRCNELGVSRAHIPFLALHDAVETYATARGAMRYRVLVL